MSATPTRVDWVATTSPLQDGNRVLESIARQEALRALLAFSSLREQIRNRREAAGRDSERDLFETERFILDEVLQLICDRAQAITRADGIVVALAERPTAERRRQRSTAGRSEMVCRAAAGPLAVERGVHLIESEFLQDCLKSGRILRCDDCEIDDRVELDFACQMGARSTVLVPLRGRREQLGVLQAFSRTPWAFTDQDVRCFDLFAELVLSALRPEDQDRRIHWLSDVADDVLGGNPDVAMPVVARAAAIETPKAAGRPRSDLAVPEQPAVIPAALDQLGKAGMADEHVYSEEIDSEGRATFTEGLPSLPFLQRVSLAGSSHPGLSVVMGLVAVAALFSAGAWWGMQEHGKAPVTKVVASRAGLLPQTVKSPNAPAVEVLSLALSDNLMNPETLGGDAAPLSDVAESKLATLPKVTGVRHWSSSVGSTVVIDMEDQVPYEVHRLMSPERIYFDLHDTVLSPELKGKTMDIGDASLTRVRIAQPVAGVTRVVLDTKDGSNFSVSMESSPYRLVVELRGSEKTLAKSSIAPKQFAPNQTPASVDAASSPVKARSGGGLGGEGIRPAFAGENGEISHRARRGSRRLGLGHGWTAGIAGKGSSARRNPASGQVAASALGVGSNVHADRRYLPAPRSAR